MTGALEIRNYTEDDEAGLLRLVRELQTYESRFYNRMIASEEIAGWYVDDLKKQCMDFNGHIRVALIAGKPMGYSTILTQCRNEQPDELPFDYAMVGDLVVVATARGKGLGRSLLEDAEAIARKAGAKWLRIGVLAKNTVARDVYGRYGFEEHMIEMEKPLT
jgi:GNAT superfamily N-acetyltransferase